jgi:hypothetical protein
MEPDVTGAAKKYFANLFESVSMWSHMASDTHPSQGW